MNYQIPSSAWKCAATGRELRPGEKYFGVLFDRGDTLERRNFCAESWQGPPPEAFGFWMGRVPAKEQPNRLPIDEEMLFDCFQRLAEETEPQKINFRYILALLLMRRKRLKFDAVRIENEIELLMLRDGKTRKSHKVVNPRLTDAQLAAVQEEVHKVLGLT